MADCAGVQGVVVDRGVATAIDGAITEDGSVRDSASDNVRRARNRVTTLQGRLRGILQNQAGEVTEQVLPLSLPCQFEVATVSICLYRPFLCRCKSEAAIRLLSVFDRSP